jgi:myosin I
MGFYFNSFLHRIEFKIKKEGWGGGGTRTIKFIKDSNVKEVQEKSSGKLLTVSAPPGLPSSTSKL